MPLPSGGTPWPPKNLAPIYDQFHIWSTWYEGDPDNLAGLYGDYNSARPINRPSTYRGGVVGTLARWFWGSPVPNGERRTKLHVPVASDLASISADLMYSEPPSITVEDSGTQERINELIDGGLHAALLESAEIGSALGGSYLRICWDTSLSDRPWIVPVHADAAVPEWRWGKLSAVTFWRVVEHEDGEVLRHLERHEPGVILNGLYRGTIGDLGKPIDLTAHESTRSIQPVVETGIPKITASYIPNMRPARQWRSYPGGANLGRSDYSGIEPWFDALDEVYTSWQRDIRLAKARLIVPDSYLENLGPGKGSLFDPDREIYETLRALPSKEGMDITPQQFAIRVAEHQQTAQEYLQVILRTAGYSSQTFGLAGDVAMTATEVAARERRSLITRDRKIVYARPELEDLVETWLMVDAVVYGSGVTVERPNVVFGDGVSEDAKDMAETVNLLAQAQSASIEVRVRYLHPDWDEAQVLEEVDRIKAENNIGSPVDDPMALRPSIDLGGAEDPVVVDDEDAADGQAAA